MDEIESWLENIIEQSKSGKQDDLQIPIRTDGSEYTIDALSEDQKEALAHVLQSLQSFVLRCNIAKKDKKMLRLTVLGAAGSGKSMWINTLATLVRKMFQDASTVQIFAPTGAAAFNAGCETIHRGCMLPI